MSEASQNAGDYQTKNTLQVWVRFPPSGRSETNWDSIEAPVALERNLYGHPLARTALGKHIGRSTVQAKMVEKTSWKCLYFPANAAVDSFL